jgi:hypothetical protein
VPELTTALQIHSTAGTADGTSSDVDGSRR